MAESGKFFDLERVDEFSIYIIRNQITDIINYSKTFFINEEDALEFTQDISSINSKNDITDEIIELVGNFINSDSNHIEGESIPHEAADLWIFEDGIWHTELYENHGWYFWQEPEGQQYGLFRNKNEALDYASNWLNTENSHLGCGDRSEQKKIVLKKWDELISELSTYLEIGRNYGGTLGHRIGSMRDKQIRQMKNFNNYT